MKQPHPTRTRGLSLIFVLLILILVGLVYLVVIPNFVVTHHYSPKNACIANLKQIDGAKEQWVLENKKTVGTPADAVAINSYLKNSQPLICPTKGVYTYNPVGTNPTCSRGPTQGHTL